MVPIIWGALAALEVVSRISGGSQQNEELRNMLVEADRRFSELCDVLGCAHDFSAALSTAQLWRQALDERAQAIASMDDELADLEQRLAKAEKAAKAAKARKTKP